MLVNSVPATVPAIPPSTPAFVAPAGETFGAGFETIGIATSGVGAELTPISGKSKLGGHEGASADKQIDAEVKKVAATDSPKTSAPVNPPMARFRTTADSVNTACPVGSVNVVGLLAA